MKKKMIALLAGALMMLASSSAFAFTQASLELYRVVFDSTSNSSFETMTDLGSISSILGKASGTVLDSSTSVFTNVANYGTVSTNGSSVLKVGYFAVNLSTSSVYLATTDPTTSAPSTNPSKFSSVGVPLLNTIVKAYAATTGNVKDASLMTSTLTSGTGNTNSFKKKGDAGSYGGYLTTPNNAFPSLATLATTDIMHLYFFNGDAGVQGSDILNLSTNVATGQTTTLGAPAPTVPIPPSFFLMGSGLLGMIGMRRKQRG